MWSKKGNWGDWATIHSIMKKPTKVSCLTCNHYLAEDGSCSKTAVVPKVEGNKFWKKCAEFMLSPEFDTLEFREQVKQVKGKKAVIKENPVEIKPIIENKEPDKNVSCKENLDIEKERDIDMNKLRQEAEERQKKHEEFENELFRRAENEASCLYSKLYLWAIKNYCNLAKISREITERIKLECKGHINELLFLNYAALKMGVSLSHIAIMSVDEEQAIVYDTILNKLEEDTMYNDILYDDYDNNYFEIMLCLEDYKNPNYKNYYMNLREASMAGQIDSLPNINSDFNLGFFYNASTGVYGIDVSLEDDLDYDNPHYLQMDTVCIYTEKQGRLADFINKRLKKLN